MVAAESDGPNTTSGKLRGVRIRDECVQWLFMDISVLFSPKFAPVFTECSLYSARHSRPQLLEELIGMLNANWNLWLAGHYNTKPGMSQNLFFSKKLGRLVLRPCRSPLSSTYSTSSTNINGGRTESAFGLDASVVKALLCILSKWSNAGYHQAKQIDRNFDNVWTSTDAIRTGAYLTSS